MTRSTACLRAALFTVAALALAACGGDSDGPSESPPEQTPAPAHTPAPTPTPSSTPSPTPTPAPTTLAEVTAFLASFDALWATAVPSSGAARTALSDSCYLEDGRTKAFTIAELDANPAMTQERDRYRVGERRQNTQILAERDSANADGSARKEVDVQFDIAYADGSVNAAVQTTLISGSSFGSCATPQDAASFRFFGNRKLVRADVRVRNLRDQRYSLAGAPRFISYRRDVQFLVEDPMGNATYAILSGPGPQGAGGQPFSLKLVSPRLLRGAPEFAGKAGNYLNWQDDDGFRICRVSGTGVPLASVADCTGQGVGGNSFGWTTQSPNSTADAGFANQGWVAGGSYTFEVFNDDGWKTVNGHAGRTPIATYVAQLENLPYTFVQMAGSGPAADGFAQFTAPTDPAALAANLGSANPVPVDFAWTALPATPDGRAFRPFQIYEYFEGPAAINTAGTPFPAYRVLNDGYDVHGTLSSPATPIAPKLPEMAAKTYGEFALVYLDRNDSLIFTIVSFD